MDGGGYSLVFVIIAIIIVLYIASRVDNYIVPSDLFLIITSDRSSYVIVDSTSGSPYNLTLSTDSTIPSTAYFTLTRTSITGSPTYLIGSPSLGGTNMYWSTNQSGASVQVGYYPYNGTGITSASWSLIRTSGTLYAIQPSGNSSVSLQVTSSGGTLVSTSSLFYLQSVASG